MHWIAEHWQTIAAVIGATLVAIPALAGLINRTHRHYSGLSGPKWLKVVSAVAAFAAGLRSLGADRWLKLPYTRERPPAAPGAPGGGPPRRPDDPGRGPRAVQRSRLGVVLGQTVDGPYRQLSGPRRQRPPVSSSSGVPVARYQGDMVGLVLAMMFGLCALLTALGGCGSWQKSTALALSASQTGLEAVKTASAPLWDKKCRAAAVACIKKAKGNAGEGLPLTEGASSRPTSRPTAASVKAGCVALHKCRAARADFGAVLKKISAAIEAARVLLVAAFSASISDSPRARAMAAAGAILGQLAALRVNAKALGVLP